MSHESARSDSFASPTYSQRGQRYVVVGMACLGWLSLIGCGDDSTNNPSAPGVAGVSGATPSAAGASNAGASSATSGASTGGAASSMAGEAGTGGFAATAGNGGVGGAAGGGFPGGASSGGGYAGSAGQAGTSGQAGSGGQGGAAPELASRPPMGWNSWNTFGCNNLTEALIKGVADTFVSSGMKEAGYEYVNLDDCWMDGRDATGNIKVNAQKFPSGMASLATYVHDKGLKLGLYSTPGTKTCANIYGGYAGGAGSLGHETADARSYAEWKVDYLKYDKCTAALSGFATMRDALKATGRPIFYSINPGDGTGCVPGKCSIDLPKTAHMWRIGFDINASWSSVVSLIDQNAPLSQFAGPGHWNDPDMLEVGKLANETEDRAHFSMWAMMAAPLLAGNDIRSMSSATKSILTNVEVIAIDQDARGVQGAPLPGPTSGVQTWVKKLSGTNTVAVALLNRGGSAAGATVKWSDVGLPAGKASVRDLWSHSDLGDFDGSYPVSSVPSHGVTLLKIASKP